MIVAAMLLQATPAPAATAPVCAAPLGDASVVVSPEVLTALRTTQAALRSRIREFGCFDRIVDADTSAADAARWRVSIMYVAGATGEEPPARMMILDRTGAVAPITADLRAGADEAPAAGGYVGRSMGGTGAGLTGLFGALTNQSNRKVRTGAARVPTAAAAKRPSDAASGQPSSASRKPLGSFAYGRSPSADAMRIAFGKLAAAVPVPVAAPKQP